MLLAGAVISLLILLSAFFVAAEYSAVSARRSRVRRLAEDGNALAARLLPVLDEPDLLYRYIAASQIGITVLSLVLGAYAEATLGPHVDPLVRRVGGVDEETARSIGTAIVLVCLTTLSVIVGELVPKSLALQNPTGTALVSIVPMRWAMRGFAQAIAFLNGSAASILRLVGCPTSGHRHVHSPEEIALLIAESRDGGLLEPQEQVRLHRALRLGLRTARQLMVPRARLNGVEAATPVDDVLRVVVASPYSRLPVYQGSVDNVIGILHTKDVVTRYVRDGTVTVAGLLRPILRVPETMAADRLLAFMRERRSHQALVVDVPGRVVGLITLEDVVAELLGGVADEFKTEQLRPIRLSDGRLRVPGMMRLDLVAQLIGRAWKSAATTIGAYVVDALGRVPEPGEQVTIEGVEMEIEAVDADAVGSLIIGRRSEEGAE
jgi:magnesium and cobalt exporter, CNNM family